MNGIDTSPKTQIQIVSKYMKNVHKVTINPKSIFSENNFQKCRRKILRQRISKIIYLSNQKKVKKILLSQ